MIGRYLDYTDPSFDVCRIPVIPPQNQQAEALYYLITKDSVTLMDVINESGLYKFQTRLGEVEQEYGQLAERIKESFTNKFNRKGNYFRYKSIDKERLIEVYNEINK